jgi:hypothetical protein
MLMQSTIEHNPINLKMTTINVLEVNASAVNASEVSASEVSASEVSASEVSASEVSASEVSASEVSASETVMRRRTGFELFRMEQQNRMKSESSEKFNLITHMPLIAATWKNSSNEYRAEFKNRASQCSPVPRKPSRKTRKRVADADESDTTPLKKKRKQRDPDLPKRPSSAFIHFSCERRRVLSREFPSMKPTEMLKCMGLEWGQLADRGPYKEMSDLDKIRYTNALAEMVAQKVQSK